MDEENVCVGVFFRTANHEEYLIAIAETQDIAEEIAAEYDEEDYIDACDEYENFEKIGPAPKPEDFKGGHYTGLIAREMVDENLLSRGVAQRV